MQTKPVLEYADVDLQQNYTAMESRQQPDISSLFSRNIPLSLPIVSAPMETVTGMRMAMALAEAGGIGVTHRFDGIKVQTDHVAWVGNYYFPVVGSIGITGTPFQDASALLRAGAKGVVIDVAHGGMDSVGRLVWSLKREIPELDVIAGNVMTGELAKRLEDLGADAIRVGIGPGHVCTTRTNTGVGGGQLTAVAECAEAVSVPVIADGGIKEYGDIVKALAAGASSVMIGSMFAGCPEAPTVLNKDGKRVHHGSAYPHEGRLEEIAEKPSVSVLLAEIEAALRSGMTYLNAMTIKDMPIKAVFRLRASSR